MRNSVTIRNMRTIIGFIFTVIVAGLLLGAFFWLLWWLVVVAAVVAVAGFVWRAVTQR